MTLVEKFTVVALASPVVARPPAETGTQIDTQALAAQDTVVGEGSIEAGGGVAAGLSSSLPSLSRTQRPRRAARDAQFCVAQSKQTPHRPGLAVPTETSYERAANKRA